jgi:hypothetical protein
MNKKYLAPGYPSLALFLLFALFSCNEDPVFQPLAQETIDLEQANSDSIEIILNSGSEYVELEVATGIPAYLIGRAEEIETIVIQEFIVPDTLGYIEAGDIISSQIYFHHENYGWGNLENPHLEFNVHTLEDDIFKYKKWEDIDLSKMGEFPSAGFSSDLIFPESTTITPDDSLTILDFDTSIIAKWLQIRGEGNSATISGRDINKYSSEDRANAYTIAVKPSENSDIITRYLNEATQFDSKGNLTAKRAKIKVVYKEPLDTNIERTIWLNSSFNKTFFNAPQPQDKKSLTIQAGATIRANLFFNMNEHIPKYAGIISSELHLTLDQNKSKFGNQKQDSILSADLLGTINQRPAVWDFKGYRESNTDKYIFRNMAAAFDIWASGDNYGRIYFSWQKNFEPLNELLYLDKYVFFGPDAEDPKKRPKLIVFYYERKGLNN